MTKFKPLPTQQELHELFDYSVVTGALYWKNHPRYKAWTGREAGSVYTNGYRTIELRRNGQRLRYTAQRIIWKWVTGEDPGALCLDHIDHDRTNNAFHNLRLASKQQNRHNQFSKGWTKTPAGRYRVMCGPLTINRYVGTFATEAEARAAYEEASKRLHGEFSSVR